MHVFSYFLKMHFPSFFFKSEMRIKVKGMSSVKPLGVTTRDVSLPLNIGPVCGLSCGDVYIPSFKIHTLPLNKKRC